MRSSSIGAQTIIKQCSQGNVVDCGLIIRDPAGNLFGVNNNPQNVQSVLMSGVDFETRYRFGLGNLASWLGGNVTLRGILNYVSRFETATLGVTNSQPRGRSEPSDDALDRPDQLRQQALVRSSCRLATAGGATTTRPPPRTTYHNG